MMTAMNMPMGSMPAGGMMSGPTMMPVMGMVPMMSGMNMPMASMPSMGMMPYSSMMPNMMPSLGMMVGFGAPSPMMGRCSFEVGKDGIVCKIAPAEGASMEMMRERAEAMTKAMAMGMPMMMVCGGALFMCLPSGK